MLHVNRIYIVGAIMALWVSLLETFYFKSIYNDTGFFSLFVSNFVLFYNFFPVSAA